MVADGWLPSMMVKKLGIIGTLFFLLLVISSSGAASSPAIRSEEVRFSNMQVELAGTLLLPLGKEPFAAIVFLHGSGCSTRKDLQPVAEALVERGHAALIFDKRGCGASTGSWVASSLFDLAADAQAALRYLASRPEVDPARVGLWGISQSGWITPIVASRSERASFLIVVTGGGASPREVEMFGYEQQLRRQEIVDEEMEAARKLLDTYFAYLATGKGRDSLLDLIAAAKEQTWYSALNIERVLPSETSRPAWEWVATYDPSLDIKNITIPTLVLLGAKDDSSPIQVTATRWITGLAQTGVSRSRVVIFPEAGHGLTVGGHHGHRASRQYVPGYFSEVANWLQFVLQAPAKAP